jgi:hypothetical protein
VVPGGISLEGKPKRRSSWFCSCELEKKGKRVKEKKGKEKEYVLHCMYTMYFLKEESILDEHVPCTPTHFFLYPYP